MEFWQILGNLHPKLVQFPLVLLLTGLVFDAIGLIRRASAFHWAAKILTGVGTFFLLFAFICGIYAEVWAGRAGIPQEQIEWHELMANIASWGFVILAAWRLMLEPENRKSLSIYTVIGLGWYVLLAITAYLGGRLVFDYGTAVVGARANDVMSMHDLNVLATRQTDLNLRYSEWMHHIFGWLTLVLSGSLFAHALFPKKADKLRWVGPTLLLGGGIFLFFFADRDLYRFLDPHQLRDREVQLHKSLAIIMSVVGAVGLWKTMKPTIAKLAKKTESLVSGWLSTPSKVVAIMALIGGGMLFTHVHTVAPYANVAAGVYVAHVVLGLVALGIGATRLLQDGWPRFRHFFAISFAVLMCVESVLLITYNEGLPWYIGYGTYNRWGWDPVKNENTATKTIAPYGAMRAELSFNENTQMIDVLVLDRMRYQRVNVPAKPVQLLVSRGYVETAVELEPVEAADGSCSHFSAYAPFLKNVPAFSARLALPVNGEMKMGYFDPWVVPILMENAFPPNEYALYQCPMHEGIQSEKPGVCPLCGMPLMPIQRTPRMTLFDLGYHMDLATAADPEKPGPLNVVWTFTPKHDGKLLRDLAIMHEHPLHLIIVSQDLSFYDHVHPVLQADGSLTLAYSFARPGSYLLFADITPAGDRNQVFRLPVTVGEPVGENPTGEPDLAPRLGTAKPVADHPGMTAELIFQPRTPTAGLHTHFLIRLTDNGLPVTDLEPLMGAMGHCVMISQDTQTYLHCHPEQLYNPRPDDRGGPEIDFHAVFPHPGLYKLWGQFKRNGKTLVVDFVVDVQKPILPPKVINFLLDD